MTCFVDAFGGDLAHGLAVSADSQSQSQILLGPVTMVDKGARLHDSMFQSCVSDISHDHDAICGPSLLNQSSFSHHAGELHDARFVGDATVEEDVPSVVDTTFILPSSDASQDDDDCDQLLSTSILHYIPDALPSSGLDRKRARTPEGTIVLIRDSRNLLTSVDHNHRICSRIPPKIPTDFRKAVSEPVSRRNTPLTTVRPYSIPVPNKRIVFDCVEVPTLRSILEREKTLRSQSAPRPEVRLSPTYRAPPAVRAGSTARVPSSPLPPSVSSEAEDDEDDWHDPRGLERTSSGVTLCISSAFSTTYNYPCTEIVVDESLAPAYPSSPPRSQGPSVQGKANSISAHLLALTCTDSGVRDRTPLQIRAQTEVPLSGPSRVPLRRSKTASARLDALHDAYTAVTDGASQLSVTDSVKATTPVHEIGAALNEQINKRFGKPTK